MKVCLKDHVHSADRLEKTWTGKPYILGTEFDCNDAKSLKFYEGEDYIRAKTLIDGIREDEKVCLMDHDHSRVCPISGADYIPGDAYNCIYAMPVHVYAGEGRPKAVALNALRPKRG